MILAPLDQIQELIDGIVRAEGMELIDIEFKPGRSRSLLRIFIDKTGGVTLDDCENISRQVGAVLDVKDLVKDSYVLEVSSPGIDRPFQTDRDYVRAVGRIIKVYFLDQKGQSAQLVGRLLQVSDAEIVVEEAAGIRKIHRDAVKRAHQEIVLGHPQRDSRKRK